MTDRDKKFEEAYMADREMRSAREEELQAAKEYLGVLLEEMEGRNEELEETRRNADILRKMLDNTEEEIKGIRRENQSVRKRGRFAGFWMFLALFETVIIIVLLLIVLNIKNREVTDAGNDKAVTSVDIQDNPEITKEPSEEIKPAETVKHVENLSEKLESLDETTIEPFTATVETINGNEYLCFTCPDVRICYRNEYYTDEMSFRKSIIIENDSKRMQCNRSYDLNASWDSLCPKMCTLDGIGNAIVLTEYAGKDNTGIPETISIVSCRTLEEYGSYPLKQRINLLMTTGFSNIEEETEKADMMFTLETSKALYRYRISEAFYNEIEYNQYTIPELDRNFVLDVKKEGIEWSTCVCLGDAYYLGRLTGKISVSDGKVAITGAQYGAFVPANQEDEEFNGIINPAEEIPEEYLNIPGRNEERYLVAKNEKIKPCVYDWDNLDTSDSNNWIYRNEKGETVSIRGIDVSKYQGTIDWKQVKETGVEYAIIRMGFRGMNEGTLEIDPYYKRNIQEAVRAGLKVGIYFFSQAVNEEEAVEEAEFVLKNIEEYEVTYPVVFDTERVAGFDARANNLSRDERTRICASFCDRIADGGYKPMIYANTKYMVMGIDLEKLEKYDKWFAYYDKNIKFPYDFQMLQYSESGRIPGITGNVDLNISFVDYGR